MATRKVAAKKRAAALVRTRAGVATGMRAQLRGLARTKTLGSGTDS